MGDEGQLDQDGWHVRVDQDIQSVDAERGNLHAPVGGIKDIDKLVLDTTDRGVKIATLGVNGLYVLTNTDMPAVLVELAFITNPDDEEILANAQDALARAVARGITDYEQLILGGK